MRTRGAAFIEFALAVPLMMLFGLGIVEMGLGWFAANDVNAAARDAGRAATSAPAYLTADRTALLTIGTALSTDELNGIKKVIVYNASGASDTRPSATCLAMTPSNGTPGSAVGGSTCNVYGLNQVKWVIGHPNDLTYFGGNATQNCCTTTEIDKSWCPASRSRSRSTDNLDYIGVYIEIKHTSVTKFGFGDMTIRRSAVFRLEPKYGGQ
jgi:Flp pilus assembly protein TadG